MSTRAFLIGLVMLAMGITPAHATTTTWQATDGLWSTEANWDEGLPVLGSTVNIGSGSVTYNINAPAIKELLLIGEEPYGAEFWHSANTLELKPIEGETSTYLFLDNNGKYILSDTGTLLKGPGEIKIGVFSDGSFTQRGGTFEFEGMMYVGDQSGASGSYYMSGGTLTGVGSGDKDIVLGEHDGSQGSFEHSGGIVDIGSLTLGRNGGEGSYSMSGKSVSDLFGQGTSLADQDNNGVPDTADAFLGVNEDLVVGGQGTGKFSQSGGVVFVKNFLTLGRSEDSYGYTLGEGLLWTGNTFVGAHGQADFYQYGGLHLIGVDPFADMAIINDGTSHYLDIHSGSYEMAGGRLLVASELIGTGGKENSLFWQRGGEHRVFKDLTVGSSSAGAFNMYGGTLEVGSTDIPQCELRVGDGDAKGVFNQGEDGSDDPAPTSVIVHGNLVVDNKPGVTDHSTYILRSGQLQTDNTFIGRNGPGSFNQYDGIHRVGVDDNGNLISGLHQLVLGQFYGSQGDYFMQGGVLEVGSEFVGSDGGRGSFFQTGGTHKVLESLFVGSGSAAGTGGAIGSFALDGDAQVTTGNTFIGYDGGSGSLRLGGSAKLIENDRIVVGATPTDYSGIPSNGVVYQGYGSGLQAEYSSSSVQAGQLILGRDARATGTYNLNSGTLRTRLETIGNEGTATFTQTGGSNTADKMTIGSRGEYTFKDGTLDVDTLINNGLFQGTGGITVNSFTNHGTLAPGNSPGTLAITGDFTQDAMGILQIELGGRDSSLFDVLNITGTATLAGTLQISLWEDFKPIVGSTFNFLVATGGIADGFSSILGPSGWKWDVAYLNLDGIDGIDTAQLTASAVPLPGAAVLFGSGLLGLVGLRRRQIR